MPEKLQVPSGAMGPMDKDVMAQLSNSHPIQMSEAKVRPFYSVQSPQL